MQLNPKRKQQYLDGEVGLIYNQEPIDRLWMIDPNVYGNNQIYWRSDKTPESFKPVAWFFEEDVVKTDTPTTDDYKEVIRQMLDVYVFNVNGRGELKTPLSDIMQLIDKAKSMIN